MRLIYFSLLLFFVTGCGSEPVVPKDGASDKTGRVVPSEGLGDTTEPLASNKEADDTIEEQVPNHGEPYLFQPVLVAQSWEEDEQVRRLSATVKRVGFEYQITFTETTFDENAHVIEFEEYGTLIDGRIANGVDGGSVPRWELSRIEVEFDGQEVEIPEQLYSDCYQFWMTRIADASDTLPDGVVLRIFDNGVLQVSALASDAAGTYLVHWWFGGDQPAVRRIAGSEAEMHSFDDNWKTDPRIVIQDDAPVPFTLLAIAPEMDVRELK